MTSVLTRVRVGEHLVIDEVDVDGVLVAALIGDLDLSTAPGFAEYLDEVADGGHSVIVDLEGLEFIGSRGVSAILVGENAVEASGGHFNVRGAKGIVRRVLQLASVEMAD